MNLYRRRKNMIGKQYKRFLEHIIDKEEKFNFTKLTKI
jgi:hypothetical protein